MRATVVSRMRATLASLAAKEKDVYRLNPMGPKPKRLLGIVYNSQIVVFCGLLFTVPPLCMLLYTRGQVSLTREELEQEKRDQMDAVLFKTKGSMQTDWAEKRQGLPPRPNPNHDPQREQAKPSS